MVLTSPPSPRGAAPAQQPFTRRAHAIDDQLLPQHHPRKHHVDIRVLDALARRLEGWHRTWIAIEIRTLVYEAGVSQASVTRALARLEAAEVIQRRRKPTPRGRYIWEIALGEAYRTGSRAFSAEVASAPLHGSVTCQDDMHGKETNQRSTLQSTSPAPEDDENGFVMEGPAEPPLAAEAPKRTGTRAADLADGEASAERQRAQLKPVSSCPATALEPNQVERHERLIAAGVNPRMAKRLVREHPLATIDRELAHLPQRLGVREPARYLVAAILDGHFAPPEASERLAGSAGHEAAEARIRQDEERARQRQERERQAEEAARDQAECQAQEDWNRFLSLPEEAREQLIATARTRVRGAAGQAPWDAPGPLRGALLNLVAERHAPDPVLASPRRPRREEPDWGQFRRPTLADTG